MFLERHHTYAMIAVKLGIRKAARIEVLVRMYRKGGELSFYKPIGRPLKAEAEPRELETYHHSPNLLNRDFTAIRPNQN
jgi:hypothetical protein